MNPRIVFMGTPAFAVASLKTLVDHKINVVGVVTAPDKPAGRGRKLHESDVKRFATEQNLNTLQPTNLKKPEFVSQLKALKPDIMVVVAFRMLPKEIWTLPSLGTFNLHASLLPQFRGAAPINWAIIRGKEKTGVTTFFIDEAIDTGNIILQKEVSIDKKTTAGKLHNQLMEIGSDLVLKTIQKIASRVLQTNPQDDSAASSAPKLNAENTKINWSNSLKDIYNLIRGLHPYPSAWCYLQNKNEKIKIKIHAASIIKEAHSHNCGQVFSTKKTLKVAVKNGYLNILSIQLPGKKTMDTQSLLNGYTFEENAKVE